MMLAPGARVPVRQHGAPVPVEQVVEIPLVVAGGAELVELLDDLGDDVVGRRACLARRGQSLKIDQGVPTSLRGLRPSRETR